MIRTANAAVAALHEDDSKQDSLVFSIETHSVMSTLRHTVIVWHVKLELPESYRQPSIILDQPTIPSVMVATVLIFALADAVRRPNRQTFRIVRRATCADQLKHSPRKDPWYKLEAPLALA